MTLLILVLIASIAVVRLDVILHYAIRTHGSLLIGAPVSVSKVNVNIKKGTIELLDVVVKNPSEIGDGEAVNIPKVTIRSKLFNLIKRPMIIDKIVIQDPTINIEYSKGTSNLSLLKNSVASQSNSYNHIDKVSVNHSESSIIVKVLTINNINLHAEYAVIRGSAKLGSITINDMGEQPLAYEVMLYQALDQIGKKIDLRGQIELNIAGEKFKLSKTSKKITQDIKKELSYHLKNSLDKIFS